MAGGGDSGSSDDAATMSRPLSLSSPSPNSLSSPSKPPPPPPPPRRRHHRRAPSDALSYFTFYFAGLAVLAPWNALITCSDVWESYFPGQNVPRLLTACYLPVTLLLMGVLLALSHERTWPRARAVGGLAAFAVLVAVVPLWDAVASSSSSSSSASAGTTATRTIPASALLTIAVLVGVADGLAQPAVYGEAALLPSRFTQAVCAGTAASGALTSVIRIITKAAFDRGSDNKNSGGGTRALAAFFGASAVECAGAAALFALVLPRTKAARSLAAGHVEARASLSMSVAAKGGGEERGGQVEMANTTTTTRKDAAVEESSNVVDVDDGENSTNNDDNSNNNNVEARGLAAAARHPVPSRKRVARHMWPCALAMVAIYGVTISLFPAAFSDVQVDGGSGWFFVAVAALFNFADLLGKSVPAMGSLGSRIPRPMTILGLSLSRVLFVPALVFSARARTKLATAGLVSVVSFLLGVSNGYLTVCSFIASSAGLYGRDAEDAGTAAVFALVAGLVVGSGASFLFLIK